jgi:hypothetical protein
MTPEPNHALCPYEVCDNNTKGQVNSQNVCLSSASRLSFGCPGKQGRTRQARQPPPRRAFESWAALPQASENRGTAAGWRCLIFLVGAASK